MATDIRALGRLAETVGGAPRPRRRRELRLTRHAGLPAVAPRPRVPRALVWLSVLSVLALAWVGMAANKQASGGDLADQPAVETVVPAPARPGVDQALDRSGRAGRVTPPMGTAVFATVDGLPLALPHAAPVLVAFHEATRAEALALAPVGRLLRNDNETKFDAPADEQGADYVVLSSRGRARAATSAVDVAVPEGSLVSAPVTGKVVEIREYVLYGSTRDWRVVIEPADRPDLHVVLIHLHQPRVQVGDPVDAGSTVLAAVRALSFSSHIDYVIADDLGADGARYPHTHLEVKPATRPEPFDPNEPAVPAAERP